jgi:hypothetical protein
VPGNRGSRDRHHRPPFVRQELRAGGEIDIALRRHGILRAIAFGIVGKRIDQEIDRLIAFQIDDAQGFPLRTTWCQGARAATTSSWMILPGRSSMGVLGIIAAPYRR